jgi:phosphoglycerate dehydrogenase-like enzyme
VRIALLDDYQDVGRSMGDWGAVADADVTPFTEHIAEEDRLVRALDGFDAVVAMRERTRLPRAVLERLPSLRVIVTTGMGNAAIDMVAARELGITVCGTGGIVQPTSELTWALVLAVLRHVPADAHDMASGGWQTRLGRGLAGRRLGLVGLGRIGALVARVGLAFEMDVVAWSTNLTAERAAEVGVARVERDELFSTSDVVSVHLVLSDRTRHLIGRR